MRQKLILMAAAVAIMVSGIAAVSAYESHLVNVTAHVENALDTPDAIAIGGLAAFPEEWLTGEITVTTSQSFKGQSRVNNVDFLLCAEPKPMDASINGGAGYTWAGGFTFVSTDGGATWSWIGPTNDFVPPSNPAVVCTALTGTVTNAADATILVGMDMPVDPDYYNPETDVDNKPRDDNADCGVGLGEPCVVEDYDVTGEDFGLDVKIQVVDIY
jgi:hypothetical protein